MGAAFQRVLGTRAVPLTRDDLDLTRLEEIPRVLNHVDAPVVINCAAYTDVDAAETKEDLATSVNGLAVESMSQWASIGNRRLLTFSTDYVFDGTATTPYTESSPTNPINAYGRSKLVGEHAALERGALIVRTSWLLSGSHPNFVTNIIRAARAGPVRVVEDQVGSPTVAADLAVVCLDALNRRVTGLLHVTNQGQASRFELALRAIEEVGMDRRLISPCSSDDYTTTAKRPAYSVMDSERLDELGIARPTHWAESLGTILREMSRSI